MSASSRLRIAVIGAGRLGGFHAQKLAKNPKAELVAVVDPVESPRQRVAAECKTQAVADYRSLLGRIDAAVISAPTQFHHSVGMELAAKGIHLLVEKPICATAREADELVRAANRNRIVLQVGHVERFNPAFLAAEAAVSRPKYIESVRAGGFTFRSMDIGVVLDLMVHDIDLVLSLVRSPPRRIEAMGLSVLGGHEDVAQARIEFRCGCVANLAASRVSCEPARRMQVWSARAMAAIDFATRATTIVWPSDTLLRREFDAESLAAEAPDRREHVLQQHLRREDLLHDAVDALALEQEDFLDSIRWSQAPRVTGEQGRDAVAVAEQILGRIRAHAWDDQSSGPIGPLAAPPLAAFPSVSVPDLPSSLPPVESG